MAILTGTDGGDDFFSENTIDTIVGGAGYDTWTGLYYGVGDLTFAWDAASGDGYLSNGTTLSSIEGGSLAVDLAGIHTARFTGAGAFDISGADTLVIDGSGYAGQPTSSFIEPGYRDPAYYQGTVLGHAFSFVSNLDLTFAGGEDRFAIDLSPGGSVAVDAGGGTDTLVITYAPESNVNFVANADGTIANNLGSFANFEVFDLTLIGGNHFVSTLGGNDRIELGGGGGSKVNAGGGDDRILSNGGADDINGGDGVDTVVLPGSYAEYDWVSFSLVGPIAEVYDLVPGRGSTVTLNQIEWLEFADRKVYAGVAYVDKTGTEGPDILLGTDYPYDKLRGLGGDDILRGFLGEDRLEGGAGNDRLDGGYMSDAMIGGTGNDRYWVDDEGDGVIEAPNEGNDTINSTLDFDLSYASANVENLILLDGAISGIGNGLDNNLEGNAAGNDLSGGAGDDILSGYRGADRLDGGSGEDTLYGGKGADVLAGGQGADWLDGGKGADIFHFDTLETSAERDTIKKFETGIDRIEIDRSVFAGLGGEGAGALDPSIIGFGAAAATADQHIVYNQKSGVLYYDPDGMGGQAHIALAQIQGQPGLGIGDFWLV